MTTPVPAPDPGDEADPLSRLALLEGVPSAYAATRDGVDVMLRDRGLRRTTPAQTAESLLRGAHASAILDGSTSTLEEVRDGKGDEAAAAALRVSAELLSQVPVLILSPLQALARLHALAGRGTVPDAELGRPVSPEAAARLRSMAATLLSPAAASSRLPAMAVAVLVHAELVAAAPFASHNALVARAAERLVLVARGVDPASLVVSEAGHASLRAEYESNLRGYATGGQPGVHAWLLYGAEAIAAGADHSPLRR